MAMFAILYWAAPNVKHPKFRWVSPGGVVGVILWIVASAAFAFYVANFASYNKTYGALGRRHRVPRLAVDHEHRGAARAPSSTPSSSAGARSRPASPPSRSRSSSRATRAR